MVEGCDQSILISSKPPPYTQEDLYCLRCKPGFSLFKNRCQNEYNKGGCSIRDDSGRCQECHVVGTTEFATGYDSVRDEVTCKSKPGVGPPADIESESLIVHFGIFLTAVKLYILM